MKLPPGGFCVSPWVELVIRLDGRVTPCCRCDYLFGSIENSTLEEIWLSDKAIRFRKRILQGDYPTRYCEICHLSGKATTLKKIFDALISEYWQVYANTYCTDILSLDKKLCNTISEFHNLIKQPECYGASSTISKKLFRRISKLKTMISSTYVTTALTKLQIIALICADFLNGNVEPPRVATLRQINLVSVCNAKCRHCIGNYTGEITHGVNVNGKPVKYMSDRHIQQSFSRPDDMTSFFMNGSEFLMYPHWRLLLKTFHEKGIRLSLSTNGMLLTREATDYLTSLNVLRDINFSFDGATKTTVETIRKNVKYDTLIRNVTYFIKRSSQFSFRFPVTASMVLLRSNIQDVTKLVRLIGELEYRRYVNIHIGLHLLDFSEHEGYAKFYKENYTDIHSPHAYRLLEKAAAMAKDMGIPIHYSYTGSLEKALYQVGNRERQQGQAYVGGESVVVGQSI